MRRRNKAFAPSLVEALEDRITPSGQGIPHAAVIAHHHSALVHEHHTALAGHHHAARLHRHHAAPGAPAAGSQSTGTAPGPTTGSTDPAATGSDPAATGSGSSSGGSGSTAGGSGPTTGPGGGGGPGPTTGPGGGGGPGPTTGPGGGGGSGPTSVPVVLGGTVKGTAPFDGSGTVGSLGAVTTTGTLTTSGAEPVVYTGEITLVNAAGSVTVNLSGLLFGPSYLDQTIDLTYTIAGGTGAFQGATGSGQAVLTTVISSAGDSFALAFGAAPPTSA